MTTLDGLLQHAVARWGERRFLVHGTAPLLDDGPDETYAEFDRAVERLAAGLSAHGVQAGERVGAIISRPRDLVSLWFAAARTGAVLAPLNPALTRSETASALAEARPTALVVDGDGIGPAGRGEPPVLRLGDLRASPGQAARAEVGGRDPVAVLRTSGSTGAPKGCVLSHQSYVEPARAFCEWMEVSPEDRFFACLPMFHLAGQAFVAAAVAGGASVVLASRFSGSRFWDQVASSGATLFRHLGEMLAVLCRRAPTDPGPPHRLRAVYGGGAGASVAARFEALFGVPVIEGYGLTETNTVLHNRLGRTRPGSIGRPARYADVRVVGPDGRERGPGVLGEIQVRRNGVTMLGYLDDPAATAQAFTPDGWYRTGDLGRVDADGYFHFAGRSKDIVRRRGENILACEVEDVLNRNPAVAASAIVPVPGEDGGEECKAFVVPTGASVDVDSLVAWCRDSLAEFKVPRFFEICRSLPRTPTNKVDKSQLRAALALGGACYDIAVTAGAAR